MTKPSFVYVTYIRTSPEKLWQSLTDGALTRQYWAGRRVESDWTVGASVTFWFDGKVSDSGKVLECDPPRRLAYSFHVEFMEALRSEPPSRIAAISGGWPVVLSGLKSLLETGKPLKMPVPQPPQAKA